MSLSRRTFIKAAAAALIPPVVARVVPAPDCNANAVAATTTIPVVQASPAPVAAAVAAVEPPFEEAFAKLSPFYDEKAFDAEKLRDDIHKMLEDRERRLAEEPPKAISIPFTKLPEDVYIRGPYYPVIMDFGQHAIRVDKCKFVASVLT